MTRKELERRLRERLASQGERWSPAQVHTALEALFSLMERHLRSGRRIRLTGFGTLETVESPSARGYDFRSGAVLELPPRRRIRFRPARKLKRLLAF